MLAIVGLQAALILGSHAMNDAFAVIRRSAAGIGAATSSRLWSEAVASEALVFFLVGPALVARLTPGGAIVVASPAGVLRWGVMASSASLLAAALVQPLHGITFALLHLSCMRLLYGRFGAPAFWAMAALCAAALPVALKLARLGGAQ